MLALIARYAPEHRWRVLVGSGIGGLLAAVVVAVANAASATDEGLSSVTLGVLFVAVIGVMYGFQRLGARAMVTAFEQVQRGLRDDLARGMSGASLRSIERLGSRIGAATGDLAYIASTIESWVAAVQHAIFLCGVTLVIATISGKALVLWLLTIGCSAAYMLPRVRRLKQAGRAMGKASAAFGERVEGLLDGFVQIKLDGELADGVVDDILERCDTVYARQRDMHYIAVAVFTGTVILIHVLGWGPAAFASADSVGLGPALGYELVTLVRLSSGPLLNLVRVVPDGIRAEAAAASLLELLDDLPDDDRIVDGPAADPLPFETLALKGAEFAYEGEGGFRVGPIDMRVEQGSMVFVTGGNGSGKTTLMKMLLGLYPLRRGALYIDDRAVRRRQLAGYRERFTTIFSHQHLYTRLYGLAEQVEPEAVEALLERFGLTWIVRYADGAFDRLDLSSGQRMRLAMVVALLEDRPICLFDEWTANQDPETTRFYYDVLLPELQAAGKTIIAVSHDDRFFDRADHVVHLVGGRVAHPSAPAATWDPDSASD